MAADPEHAATMIATALRAIAGLNGNSQSRVANPARFNSFMRAGSLLQPATPVASPGPQTPASEITTDMAQPGVATPPTGGDTTGQIGEPFAGESGFTGEKHPFGETREGHAHGGIDFGVPSGTPLLAVTKGKVVTAGGDSGGFGNLVVIEAGGVQYFYGHMSSIDVQPGEEVDAGTILGRSGSTGQSTGPHLHFEVRVNGQAVDPAPILAGAQPLIASPRSTASKIIPADPQEVLAAQIQNAVSLLSGSEAGATMPQATTETGVPLASQGEPGQAGGNTGQWAVDILAGIGAPNTPENQRILNVWFRAEGMDAGLNNPLASTESEGGAGTINDVGVRRYPDYQTGLNATLKTLNNGLYGPIIDALRNGNSAEQTAYAIGHSPWVGKDPTAQRNYYNLIMSILGSKA